MQGDLEAPVGFDTFGYSYRSVDGSVVHQSRRTPYGSSFTTGASIMLSYSNVLRIVIGDVIGCLINLKDGGIGELESSIKIEGDALEKIQGSHIEFFKNGVSQEVAFQDIGKGFIKTFDEEKSLLLLTQARTILLFLFTLARQFVSIQDLRLFIHRKICMFYR